MIVHIEVGRVGAMSENGLVQIERDVLDSQTLTAAGLTALTKVTAAGEYFATITSDTNIWFNYSSGTPSAVADPRRFFQAGGPPRTFPWSPGVNFAVATS